MFSVSNPDLECQNGIAQFEQDVQVDSINYYSIGLIPMERNIKDYLKMCCNIYVQDIGCAPNSAQICYNERTEQYFEKHMGIKFIRIFQER